MLTDRLAIYKDYNLYIRNERALEYMLKIHDKLYKGTEQLLDVKDSVIVDSF